MPEGAPAFDIERLLSGSAYDGLGSMLLNNSTFERRGIAASVPWKEDLVTGGALFVLASLFFANSDRHACCFWFYLAQPPRHSS